MKLFSILPLLLVGVILVSGCVGQYGQQPTQPTTPTTPTTPAPTGEVKEFTISESNFKLNPATITVNKGDTVRITVINDQGTHNLFIEGYKQRVNTVSAGNTQVIEFIADKAGTFNMWCEVDGHKGLGMEGQLIVK